MATISTVHRMLKGGNDSESKLLELRQTIVEGTNILSYQTFNEGGEGPEGVSWLVTHA